MLPGICPSCGYHGDLEGFLVEVDARRAVARVAALDPAVGRTLPNYLRLFGTGKRGVQLRRAVKLIDALAALIEVGTVCRDDRGDARRPATPQMWAEGMEQMIQTPPSGALKNHNYLRTVVYSLADAADAAAERQREERARVGAHRPPQGKSTSPGQDRLANELAYLRQMLDYGRLTADEHKEKAEAARQRWANS